MTITVNDDVTITLNDGATLHASVYLPEPRRLPAPAVTLAPGFGGLRHQGLRKYAQHFAERGFVAVAHDHRGFGHSSGSVRHDIDPWQQIDDWRQAISYIESLDSVNSDLIGIWGSSYAGGHALVLAGTDPRIKAAVTQVPFVSGYYPHHRYAPDYSQSYKEAWSKSSSEPARVNFVGEDGDESAAIQSTEWVEHLRSFDIPDDIPRVDTITVRSLTRNAAYDPGTWAPRLGPKPVLFVVATNDIINPTDRALTAYRQAREPKGIVFYPGGHFDAYHTYFDKTAQPATEWFHQHLR